MLPNGSKMPQVSAGSKFRAALQLEKPLQVVGTITAFTARMAEASGFNAVYISGGGVAANSLGVPDLGISSMEDVLIDIRRITDATSLPLLVDADTGWGGAFNIARTVRSFTKAGAAGLHIEDQVQTKRCGHRPGKEVVSKEEMVDRVKAAVDARTDDQFVIMARTDALAVEGIDAAIERSIACVEAGADMIFPEAMTELSMYRKFKDAVKVPILANITEFGHTPLYTSTELGSVGVELPKDFSLKSEVLYMQFQNNDFWTTLLPSVRFTDHNDAWVTRIGLNYKFGGRDNPDQVPLK